MIRQTIFCFALLTVFLGSTLIPVLKIERHCIVFTFTFSLSLSRSRALSLSFSLSLSLSLSLPLLLYCKVFRISIILFLILKNLHLIDNYSDA
jgi:hypothetical protein